MTKWIIGVVVLVLVAGGAWWYFKGQSVVDQGAVVQTDSTPVGPDTSDQTLLNELAAIDTQMVLNINATSTAGLSAQVTIAQTIADQMAALALKLALRISALGASSTEALSVETTLSDLNTQLADAHIQTAAAFGHIATASDPTSTRATVTAEYAKTRADMVVARKEFDIARKDIETILRVLSVRTIEADTHATSTVKTETR